METASPLLEITDLHLVFQRDGTSVRALNGVSLTLRAGEAMGLVGESGSGKSTLARALLGLNPPTRTRITTGHLRIGGRDVTGFDDRAWEALRGDPAAIIFQDPLSYLNPVHRIGRQIAEAVERHTPELSVASRVAELLTLVKLPTETARSYPHELSGGMRQRALIAVALACRPQLLVADEPTTALDVTTQAEILALLAELRRSLGMAMLLISHDLGVVASSCERLAVIYAGHIVEHGPTAEIFGAPKHPYTIGLVAAAQAARDARGRFVTIPGDPPNLAALGAGCPFVPRCPHVEDRCRQQMPAPTVLAGGARWLRCWHAQGDAA